MWLIIYRLPNGTVKQITVSAHSPLGASNEAHKQLGDEITVLNCVSQG